MGFHMLVVMTSFLGPKVKGEEGVMGIEQNMIHNDIRLALFEIASEDVPPQLSNKEVQPQLEKPMNIKNSDAVDMFA